DSVSTLENLSAYFKPEFLNRFDAIITFNELSKENLLEIVDLMLVDLQDTIEENDMNITITDEAKRELVRLGYDPRFGARPSRRVIQDKIEDQLTDLILEEGRLMLSTSLSRIKRSLLKKHNHSSLGKKNR